MAKTLEWNDPRCIICMQAGKLTVEHVIPDSLGGILTCRFLCQNCNSRFGSGFEAKARLAPELRRAASHTGECAGLAEKLEVGANYRHEFDGQVVEARIRRDGTIGPAKLDDGSIITPDGNAESIIRSMLSKCGASGSERDAAISKWRNAPETELLDLGKGIVVRRWRDVPATPTFKETALSPLVPLKIAFEFAALVVGAAIYGQDNGLEEIRRALSEQDERFAKSVVNTSLARKPAPFHGIAFRGNTPEAQFQVRLFGYLAYTVRFPRIQIDQECVAYTHKLDTQEDGARVSRCAE